MGQFSCAFALMNYITGWRQNGRARQVWGCFLCGRHIGTRISQHADNCLHLSVGFIAGFPAYYQHCVSRRGLSNSGTPLLHALCGCTSGARSFNKRLRWAWRSRLTYTSVNIGVSIYWGPLLPSMQITSTVGTHFSKQVK